MKRILSFSLLSLSICAISSTVKAEILAKDTFAYPKGSNLAGAEGGSGTWQAPWKVDSQVTSATIAEDGLRFGDGTANPSSAPTKTVKAARRTFTKYSGDTVFVKLVFSVSEGTTADADRFGIFMPSYEHGALLVGTGLDGSGEEKASNQVSARTFDNGKHRISTKKSVEAEPMTVIVEWSKSEGGAERPYNKMRAWVNPTKEDKEKGSVKTMDHKELRPAFNAVGFYLAGTDAADVFKVREVTVATTWDEVMAP